MLKKQVGLFADSGVSQFDLQQDKVHYKYDEQEIVSFIDAMQKRTRKGEAIPSFKLRPIISNVKLNDQARHFTTS